MLLLLQRAISSARHRYQYRILKPRLLRRIKARLILELGKSPQSPEGVRFWRYGEAERVDCRLTQAERDRFPPSYALVDRVYEFPQPCAAVVPDVHLIRIKSGSKGLTSVVGRTASGALLNETLTDRAYLLGRLDSEVPLDQLQRLDRQPSMIDMPHYDLACAVPIEHPAIYGHWLVERLLRLQSVEHYQRETGERVALLIPEATPSWIEPMLVALGFDFERMAAPVVHVSRLVVPSFRAYDFTPAPSAVRWLKEKVLTGLVSEEFKAQVSPRIYISRMNAETRRTLNEDELMRRLSGLGFKLFDTAQCSIAEEAFLFDQARVVVASYGSGLTNIIFSNDAAVVECGGRDIHPLQYVLARALGLPYYYFECDQPYVNEDFSVDVDRLHEFLIAEVLPGRSREMR